MKTRDREEGTAEAAGAAAEPGVADDAEAATEAAEAEEGLG